MRLYAAHPMASYDSQLAARQVARLRALFPAAELLDPEVRAWATDAEWLAEWPGIVATLDLFAVFADEAGYVGTGCVHELADAIGKRVPVVGLGSRGALRTVAGVGIEGGLLPSRARVGRLVLGERVSASEVVQLVELRRALRP